jgi:hypothetical protein
MGATVSFLTTVLRPGGTKSGGAEDVDTNSSSMPVILNVSQTSANTDVNGLANIVPSSAGFGAPVEVDVLVTAGTNGWLDYPLQILPSEAIGTVVTGIRAPPVGSAPVRIPRTGAEMPVCPSCVLDSIRFNARDRMEEARRKATGGMLKLKAGAR